VSALVFPFLARQADRPLDPVVPVRIKDMHDQPFGVTWIPVDSGADATILPARWMAPLGVAAAECDPHDFLQHGGDIVPGWESRRELTMVVGGHAFHVRPAFTDLTIGVWDGAVLGRRDFFAAFDVLFSGRRDELRLYPNPERTSFVGVDPLYAEAVRVGPGVLGDEVPT
jgi:hypothetical protein